MLIYPLQFTRKAVYIARLRDGISVCACVKVCLTKQQHRRCPIGIGPPSNKLTTTGWCPTSWPHQHTHIHTLALWVLWVNDHLSVLCLCNLSSWTENTGLFRYKGTCREMNGWSQWPLRWGYYAPAGSLSLHEFAGKIVTLQHTFHLFYFDGCLGHPVENDGNSMKSQIKCESKRQWMKKIEIPAAKRNKGTEKMTTAISCTTPAAGGVLRLMQHFPVR